LFFGGLCAKGGEDWQFIRFYSTSNCEKSQALDIEADVELR